MMVSLCTVFSPILANRPSASCNLPSFSQALIATLFTSTDPGTAIDGVLVHCALRHLGQLALCQLPFVVIFTSVDRCTVNDGVILHCVLNHLGQQAQCQLQFANLFTSADRRRQLIECTVFPAILANRPNASCQSCLFYLR